jgi:hypothetical protein
MALSARTIGVDFMPRDPERRVDTRRASESQSAVCGCAKTRMHDSGPRSRLPESAQQLAPVVLCHGGCGFGRKLEHGVECERCAQQ